MLTCGLHYSVSLVIIIMHNDYYYHHQGYTIQCTSLCFAYQSLLRGIYTHMIMTPTYQKDVGIALPSLHPSDLLFFFTCRLYTVKKELSTCKVQLQSIDAQINTGIIHNIISMPICSSIPRCQYHAGYTVNTKQRIQVLQILCKLNYHTTVYLGNSGGQPEVMCISTNSFLQ